MKCDSWASLSACTFASPCFSHKPKARVAIIKLFVASGCVIACDPKEIVIDN